MNVPLYSSALTVVGLIIGAALQYRFNRAIEIRRQVNLARTECYVEYIRCISRYVHLAQDPVEAAKWNAQVLEARARLCIYGSHDVIRALARFERSRDPAVSDAYFDHILSILVAMRAQSGERAPRGLRAELKAALFHNLAEAAAGDLRRVGVFGARDSGGR